MSKFTKGPWMADTRVGCCAVYPESRKDDTNGCHSDDERNIFYANGVKVDGNWTVKEEDEANARLIAAAPEMYQMLEYLSEVMPFLDEQTHPQIEMDAVKHNIDKLLAKARGDKSE